MKKLILSIIGTSVLASTAFAKNDLIKVVNEKHENPVYYRVQSADSWAYMHGILNIGQTSNWVYFSEPVEVGSHKTYYIVARDTITGQSLTGWGTSKNECSFILRKVNEEKIILDNNTCALDYLNLDYKFPEQTLTITIHK